MQKINHHNIGDFVGLSAAFSKAAQTPEHLANPFFNIANCTTKTELLYPDLISEKLWVWRLLDSILGAMYVIVCSFSYFPKKIKLRKEITPTDVVIVSHLTNLEHLSADNDFYFENLAQRLNERGFSSHLYLINHVAAKSTDVQQETTRTVLPAYSSPLEECTNLIKLLFSVRSTPSIGNKIVEKKFLKMAKMAQFNSKALGDLRIGLMLSDLVAKSKPLFVIHTYEGHGWEKILNSKIRSLEEPPLIFGYQHAPIFPGPKSICLDLESASPNHILNTGEITRDAMMKDCKIPNIRFVILGSNKNKEKSCSSLRPRDGACLFAPEGTINEVCIMAKIAVDAASENPKQIFLLRTHPVLNRERVLSSLENLKPFPKNFHLSDNSLEDDLANSSWICYRGSSVVFQAILSGLRPIYLDLEDKAEFNDPLFGELDIKKNASTGRQLNEIIMEENVCKKIEQKMFEDAILYANRYLEPFSTDALLELLNAKRDEKP